MSQEIGLCSYFIIPPLADFLCSLFKAVSETLAVFPIHLCLLLLPETGRATNLTKKKQGNMKNKFLLVKEFLESGKWKL